MGRLKGPAAVRSISIICVLFLAVICSCITETAPEERRAAPDIEGEYGGTIARLYRPDNEYALEQLAGIKTDRDVLRTIEAYSAEGYRYVPEGSFVLAGAAGERRIRIGLLCLANTGHPQRDVIYLAAIDTGTERGIAPARLSFEAPLDGAAGRPIAEGVWLETLPPEISACGTVDAPVSTPQRWIWDEFWSCFDSLVIAGAYGCAISCLPSIPQGYMVCYFTCVGGVSIAAMIRCTMEQLYG